MDFEAKLDSARGLRGLSSTKRLPASAAGSRRSISPLFRAMLR
jgi:hypothetical protein